MDKQRAGEEELAGLHGLFARYLKERLASGDVKPAELSVIRQFLKDNGIECIGEMNNDMLDLAEELPKFEEEQGLNNSNILELREAVN